MRLYSLLIFSLLSMHSHVIRRVMNEMLDRLVFDSFVRAHEKQFLFFEDPIQDIGVQNH